MKFLKAATQKMRSWTGLLLTTLFYFIFSALMDVSMFVKLQWFVAMLFLPGITFPLVTCDYRRWLPGEKRRVTVLTHIGLSVIIYMLAVGIWMAYTEVRWITYAAGAWGSLAYLLLTKYLLKAQLPLVHIFCVTILSGVVFAPVDDGAHAGLWLGYCIGMWMLLNGGVMLYFAGEREKQIA